jgi:hypothetical protein
MLVLYLALLVLAFSIGAASRSRWLPWIVPVGSALYWLVETLRLGAETDAAIVEDQTGVAVVLGMFTVGLVAVAAGAGRLLRAWSAGRR